MSNLSLFVGVPVGAITFLFFVWKRMREDHTSDRVFSVGFIICFLLLAGFSGGYLLGMKAGSTAVFKPINLWFWTSFLGLLTGFIYCVYRFELKFFEVLETVGIGFLFWLLPIFLMSANPFFFLIVFFILLFNFLNSRYKGFSWYRSGRVGFAGLASMGVFFGSRLIVALLGGSVLSFVGKIDAIFDVVAAFIFFIALFKLSEV